jgi:hypothetical protein
MSRISLIFRADVLCYVVRLKVPLASGQMCCVMCYVVRLDFRS